MTKPGRGSSIFFAAVIVLGFVALGMARQQGWKLPPNSLPWGPVLLDEKPGWISAVQMMRLQRDDALCRTALAGSRLRYTPQKDQTNGTCGFSNVVRADLPLNIRPVATCAVTAGLYWYRRELEALAQSEMKTKLIRIDQLGTYACRNVNSETGGARSQHATANAIDIAAFRFADGRVVSVLKDYGKSTAAGRFLARAHGAACGLFNGVLGPDYNTLHTNHFHLDMGPYRICR